MADISVPDVDEKEEKPDSITGSVERMVRFLREKRKAREAQKVETPDSITGSVERMVRFLGAKRKAR